MIDNTSSQREELRRERKRLEHQQAVLRAETERLVETEDADALQAHGDRLRQHQDEMRAFTAALEQFHAQFGPLGD